MQLTRVLDGALDRSVFLGYTRLGSTLRSRWWPADPEPGSLAGKRVLVTGASSGIGEAMVGSFAALGAIVHVHGRNKEKLAAVAAELRRTHPNSEIVEEICDLTDLEAVRAWTADLRGRVESLHGLVHNAGAVTDERTESPQGHELALAAHVLGPHLVTEGLLPVLTAGPGSVVFMSSGGMYASGLRDDDPEFLEDGYSGMKAYSRTKKMQVVLADAWSRRVAGSGVKVESMHPGWVETPGVVDHLPRFRTVVGSLLRTAEDGADTAVWLVATRPHSKPGHFWHDRAQRPTTFGWQRDEDREKVRRFLAFVSETTDTSSTDWV